MGFWEDNYDHCCSCRCCCFCFDCFGSCRYLFFTALEKWLLPWPRRWQRSRQRRRLGNEDIEFLKMELRSIDAALRLVGMVRPGLLDQRLTAWADQCREASYDIQDILDTFLVRVEVAHPGSSSSSKGLLLRKMVAHSSLRHSTWRKFAEAIIEVKMLIHEIASARDMYHGEFRAVDATMVLEISERLSRYRAAADAAARSVDPALLDLIKDETWPLDPNGAMEAVIGRLSTDTNDTSNLQLKTVCIVARLGKKTLAKAVYKRLQPQFHCSAFVSLSWNPNISQVLRNILQQLDDDGEHRSEATGRWDERQLVEQLRQLLQNKRYIIAVDDIWDGKSWQAIRNATVDNNHGSRIITTTRIPEVAQQIGGAYELRPLPYDHRDVPYSFSIFRNIMLHNYYQLPSHLRLCFLYISMFPEDYEFRRDRLVWRWIAEGFIEGKEGCSLFQIGQKYLDELLNRSLIIEVDKKILDGMAKYCHAHYMALDLVCSLASDKIFVTELVKEEQPHIFRDKKVRWLSIQNSQLGRRAHTLDVGHVRSVSAFGTGIDLLAQLSSFHILRVLDLEGCDLGVSSCNPKHIGKLFHLRYLGLRDTNVSWLPKDIGNLRFLQILDLKGTRIRELPSTVALLRKLLCLYAEPETRIPKDLGNLTSLEELTRISVSESPSLLDELTSFVELRMLDIVLQRDMCERSKKAFAESLSKLEKLQTLRISANSIVFCQGAMPKLQVLEFVLDVDKAEGALDWGLNNLPSLQKVTVKLHIGNSGSANKENEAVAALRHAVGTHPNRRIQLEIATVTPHQQEEKKLIDGAENVASSSESEIQEECSA